MKNITEFKKTDKLAVQTCQQIIKELMAGSEKYGISLGQFNTLAKTYYALENFPDIKLKGFVDISVNTYVQGGGVDYNSFTLGENQLEIYTGFIEYKEGECDDSSWLKIYSSKENVSKDNLQRALECWAESFLLHLEDNPARALCIIDRLQNEGDESVRTEVTPFPKVIVPEFSLKPLIEEFDEVIF